MYKKRNPFLSKPKKTNGNGKFRRCIYNYGGQRKTGNTAEACAEIKASFKEYLKENDMKFNFDEDKNTYSVVKKGEKKQKKNKGACGDKKGKSLVECQYENKLITQKAYVRKLRKFTKGKLGAGEKAAFDYTPGSDN